jgi:hypothetical protein
MTSAPSRRIPHLDDQTILASEENFGNVSVCPGGIVHVNLTHCTLKFLPQDFVKFSELIGKAAVKHQAPPPQTGGKPRLHLVGSDASDKESPEQDK